MKFLFIALQNPIPAQVNRLFDYGVLGIISIIFIYGTYYLYKQALKQWQDMVASQKLIIDEQNKKITQIENQNKCIETEFRNYLKETAAMSINLQEEHNKIMENYAKIMERHNEIDRQLMELLTISTTTLKFAIDTLKNK